MIYLRDKTKIAVFGEFWSQIKVGDSLEKKKGETIFCGTVLEAKIKSGYEKFEDAYLFFSEDGREDIENESILENVGN